MSFMFIGRNAISNVDFYVLDALDNVVNADAPPVATFYSFASNTQIFARTTTQVDVGLYRVVMSSVETSVPGLWYYIFTYTLGGIPQQYRVDVEIPSSSSTLYDKLSDNYRAVVDDTWLFFEDLFDSAIGGPHLKEYAQSSFGREKVAQLLKAGLGRLNTVAQPHSQYSLDANDFPFTEWGPVLVQATKVEVIKHLMRSYVEQPAADGVSAARLDRRDYLDRWRTIMDIESTDLKEQLETFKISAAMSGLRPSALVSGGLFGSIPPLNSPARRPRNMPYYIR